MNLSTILIDLNVIGKLTMGKNGFDYNPVMNTILNTLYQRISDLDITLKANNQRGDRSYSIINENLFNQETNLITTQDQVSRESFHDPINDLPEKPRYHSFVQNYDSFSSTVKKQEIDNLNVPSPISIRKSIRKNFDPSNVSYHAEMSQTTPLSLSNSPKPISLNLTPHQMKIRAQEFVAIFEHAFDQLIIIHRSLIKNNFNRNNNQSNDLNLNNMNSYFHISQNSDCSPTILNAAGIFRMNERDKLIYEIEYFFHILILFFHAVLFETETDFVTSIRNINDSRPSIQLIELKNRFRASQDKIRKFSYMIKHFQTENSQDLNELMTAKSQLKDRLMEQKYRLKVSSRYCNDWKENHILQWIEMLLELEQNYVKTIDEYDNILKQTEISHQETIKTLTQQNNEIKSNTDKWYEHYQIETNRFDKELTNFRQELNHMRRQRQYLYEEYEKMKLVVDEYNQMKLNEKLLLEKQKQQEEAIRRIQAWWRGTMTRNKKQRKRRKKRT